MRKTILALLIIIFSSVVRLDGQQQRDTMIQQSGNSTETTQTQANHLIHEKSPYLLQHAHNPVDWYPWGKEALTRARNEGKPIFLSIGYSTCHWCHVMAHESFEDPTIAAFLNKHFIAIKVDREERPDIDQIYMTATQAMTGSGGWPMSVFLFPDTRPFYAGTYFPPRNSHGRPGFLELLQVIHKAWLNDREKLTQSADQVTDYIIKNNPDTGQPMEESWLDKGFKEIEENYEPKYGGFGQAPKFPRPVVMDFLLHYYKRKNDKVARDMALFTLDKMAAGGMYDHIGGGFHRYSVDARWRVPHFEKMLYDQGQLASLYLAAFQLTGQQSYKNTAIEILDYVLRDMRDPAGGFYSAEDADSVNPYNPGEHSEGAYYLWTEEEIDSLLTKEDVSLFKIYYGIKTNGNALHDPQKEFTGRNILYKANNLSQLAKEKNINETELFKRLTNARDTLLAIRKKRTAPHLDDKIITAWNGLIISALAKASMILEEDRYLLAAERATDFLLDNLIVDRELKRRWREGEARHMANLDDYSFLIQGLLDLYQASHVPSRLSQAIELTEQQLQLFTDERGGFYDTPESAKLLARMKASHDGAEPSGNSVSALNLLRLGSLTGEQKWNELAKKTIEAFGKTLATYPTAMPLMLAAMDFQLDKPRQIVIAGDLNREETKNLLREIYSRYLPNTLILLADGQENQAYLAKKLPFLETVVKKDGLATAYVCEDFTCKMPVNTRKELAELLDAKNEGS